MKITDIQREPCGCHACIVAGVAHLPQRRDPRTGAWLHGRDLSRWYAARDAFRVAARKAVGSRGRQASGFQRLVLQGATDQSGAA